MSVLIKDYDSFRDFLNEAGFVLFGGAKFGLIKLGDITEPGAWHTGDELHNPWEWKRILAERRDGAYARMLGGCYFMVSNAWYPLFVAAYTPAESMDERYQMGGVDPLTKRMYDLFEEHEVLARHEIRNHLDAWIENKSRLERSLAFLQGDMYITVSGESQQLSWDLKPVGWPSIEYARTDAWLGLDRFDSAMQRNRQDDRLTIRRRAAELSPHADARMLDRLFQTPASDIQIGQTVLY